MQNKEKGFTLLETVVAMLILTIGVISLYGLQVTSMRGGHVASAATQASNLNAEQLESLLAGEYSDLKADNANGNCNFFSNKQPNYDEVESGCLGKGNTWATRDKAQILKPQPDPNYCINYNVAAHYPLLGTKTVRVHVFTVYRSGQVTGDDPCAAGGDVRDSGLKPITYELVISNTDTKSMVEKNE